MSDKTDNNIGGEPDPNQKFELSYDDRRAARLLVVEPEPGERSRIRQALKSLGFTTIADVGRHSQALVMLQERTFTHALFVASKTDLEPTDFLAQAARLDEQMVAIPMSGVGDVEAVFSLLKLGARGYLLKPFTVDSLEYALLLGTRGNPVPDVILQARDRNEAFSAIIAGSVDRVATALRQRRDLGVPSREVRKAMRDLREVVRLGNLFATGGSEGLKSSLHKQFMELSQGPATRLGRLRTKLQHRRLGDPGPDTEKK